MSLIIYISERKFPNGNAGGVRTFNIAKIIKSSLEKILVISQGGCNNKIRRYKKLPYYYYVPFSSYFFSKLFDIYKVLPVIKYLLKGHDVSHVFIYSTNIFFIIPLILYLKLKGISYSFDVVENFSVNEDVNFFKRRCFELLYKFIFKVDLNIGIAKPMLKDFNNSLYIPATYQKVDYRFSFDKNKKNFFYFGDPFGKEDVKRMFDILLILIDIDPTIFFHGTGFDLSKVSKLKNYKSVLNNKNIILHKWLSPSEYNSLKGDMDFLFFLRLDKTSNFYNFPTKISEFMAYGKVPICNKVGCYSDYLNESNSIMVNAHDNDLLIAKNIASFVNNYDYVMNLSFGSYNTSINKLSNSSYEKIFKSFF